MAKPTNKPGKKDADEIASAAGGINMGDISQISGGEINIAGGDIVKQVRRVVNTSGGVYVEGNVRVGGDLVGGNKTTNTYTTTTNTTGLSASDIMRLFDPLYAAVDKRRQLAPEDQEDLKVELKALQQEVLKGPLADAVQLERQLRRVGRIAPDIQQAAAGVLANTAGFVPQIREPAQKLLLSGR
jgi:hypothetical protein